MFVKVESFVLLLIMIVLVRFEVVFVRCGCIESVLVVVFGIIILLFKFMNVMKVKKLKVVLVLVVNRSSDRFMFMVFMIDF